MHHLDLTHEAYVFLAVKVGSEMDQLENVKHFAMQLNIPGKNSFDERFSIFSYVTAGATSSQTILEIRLERWVVVIGTKKPGPVILFTYIFCTSAAR